MYATKHQPSPASRTAFLVVIFLLATTMGVAGDSILHPAGVLLPLKVGVSPPLRSLPTLQPGEASPAPPAEINPNNAELPARVLEARPAPTAEDPVVQRSYGPNAMPPAIVNVDGVGNLNGVLPPDTNGDVGINYYVQWINLSFAIFNKSDGSIAAGPFAGNSLWSGFGGTCETHNSGDPIVLYDHLAGRWFMSQFTTDNHQCIAVSQTGDPTGSWYLYDYLADANSGYFPDYPKFGVWPDGYYYSANMFGDGSAMVGVFERDQMLVGAPAQFIWFYTADTSALPSFSQLPADLDGANLPPAGAPNPFAEVVDDAWGYDPPYDHDGVIVTPLHVDWATPANSTFGPPTMIDMTAAGYPFDTNMCGYNRNCIPQPGTSQGLDALSSRLLYRLQYRNFGSYQTLVTSHTVDENGSDHAGVRWYELRDSGSGWVVQQAGTYAPDSDHRWMADAAMDASGDIAVGYSVSSSSTYPSIRWAGRLAGDPPGDLSQGEDTVVSGAGVQTHSAARWGDYSAMSVDPTDDCTFWYTTEYMPTTGTAPWQTRIASFKFPSCSTGPTGTIEGTVTNSATTDPLDGAAIQVGGFSTFTNASGFYTMTVPVDTYDVTASKFGFTPQTVTGIVVDQDVTVTQDFALDPMPTASFDGYVTDAGHGWPLYAKVELATGGSIVATTYTDPFTGSYQSGDLPQSLSYDFTVTPVFPGYDPMTRTAVLPPGGDTENFAFTPLTPACTAPGYGPPAVPVTEAPDAPCSQLPGGLMEGFVTDANTTDPIVGATVASDQGESTTTQETPDDPNLGNGFYWLFTDTSTGANHDFTASAAKYANKILNTDVVPDAVNQLDFPLDAGWLEVTPSHMEARLYPGETEDQLLDIINHGGTDANVSLLAFETAGWVPAMPMDAIPTPSAPPEHLNDTTARAANVPQHEPGTPLVAGDVIQSWSTGLTYPWGLGFQKYSDNPWAGNISAGGGDDLDYEFSRAGSPTGNTADTSSWMGVFAADAAFDVTNGTMWQVAVGGDNCIHEWDPSTGATTGNVICWGATISERGLAYDPVSDTFFVGGWNTQSITRFDRTGTVLQTANVGLSISGLAYNPVTGHLFVMENSPTDTVTLLDPADNYNVLGSFTISGFGNYKGAGLGLSCDGHLWAVHQGNQSVYEVDSGETGACLSASLPWFVTTPDSGVVPANEGDLPVNGQFIADAAPHWGLVQGTVKLLHDTPYQVSNVSLCLTRAFNDMQPGAFADARVHSLAGALITTGCGHGNFCPADLMTRGVMARWLITAMHGHEYSPPQCTGIFDDVPCETTPNADYIEALYNEGVTAGCATDPLRYCPDSPVLRSQMAVFVLKSSLGSDYTPPPCTGIFDDVPCPGGFAVNWIEDLYNRGITAGCTATSFCPGDSTRRDQMSVFMGKAFDLPMCTP